MSPTLHDACKLGPVGETQGPTHAWHAMAERCQLRLGPELAGQVVRLDLCCPGLSGCSSTVSWNRRG